jgi:hypothetical protein
MVSSGDELLVGYTFEIVGRLRGVTTACVGPDTVRLTILPGPYP